MLRSVFLAFAAALLVAAGSCTPAPAPQGEPALWRIADADSEIWLFGSVHVLPADVTWESPRIRAAFDRAEEFVTETNTDAGGAAAFAALAERYGTLPADAPLSSLLTETQRSKLGRVATSLGVSPASLEGTRPWLAALQLSYAAAARDGHTGEYGVESVLTARAQTQGKRLGYLETAEQQIRTLADLPRAEELRFLLVTLDEIEQGGEELDDMDRAWASGDTHTLTRLLDDDWRDGGQALHEAVVLRRNRAWADQIATKLDGSGRIFIAVGAAHLLGDGSVVALLRERGIAVEGP